MPPSHHRTAAARFMRRIAIAHGLSTQRGGILSYLYCAPSPSGDVRLYAGFESPRNPLCDANAPEPVIPLTGTALHEVRALLYPDNSNPREAWEQPLLTFHPIAPSMHARLRALQYCPALQEEAAATGLPDHHILSTLCFHIFWGTIDGDNIPTV